MSVRNVVSVILVALAAVLLLASCTQNNETKKEYMQITQEEAKNIMDTQSGYVILDVRTDEEFAAGHIPGAILIPDYEIGERAESELTDKTQLILVYCRSGRRSKNAASELASMGYSNVKEFGGIIDWQYETEK
ncbi:MAG TPA: rhodanese-like domain-containing protein [Bacillota bacterium]|nr:rhodanese-like domain-containing protein [Bacillota bacterium]